MEDVATIAGMSDLKREANERLKAPNMAVRVIGWLLRPIVWEAMRQHHQIDQDREIGAPTLNLWDALSGQNRHHGYGP